MIRLRRAFWILALLALFPIVSEAVIQTQRAQISVTITINVTPNPLGYAAPPAASDTSGRGILARLTLNAGERPQQYHAESLAFEGGELVAQNQGAVKVEASVSPNPAGTLLFSNQTGVVFSQEAGTVVTYTCPYTVTVDTTISSWTLEHGLYTDFEDLTDKTSFTGHDAANNTHVQTQTPKPSYTPFIVYSDGQSWTIADTNAGMKTYCVDLQITIPIATTGGQYNSNAVYTLLY
jgi:hypothetical protein